MNKFTINNVVIFKKLKCINLIRENRNIKFELEVFKNRIPALLGKISQQAVADDQARFEPWEG